MKYLPLREMENVTSALNFRTSDCYVSGSCDLFTIKATSDDRKLYKNIESSLESRHKSLVRLFESLSTRNAEFYSMDLSRSSPFGPLNLVSNRRTFAYLVATLNAAHPDYEFSHFLKPSDFRKENLRNVTTAVDEALNNLRARQTGALLATANGWSLNGRAGGPQSPGGGQAWGPRMWKLIDEEMGLRNCEIYCYSPDYDPMNISKSAIWSLNYFFFNKDRRRVCYLHLRAFSMSRHSPVSRSLSIERMGASKRAEFWLGDRADQAFSEGAWSGGRKDDDHGIPEPGDDEVDADEEWTPSDMYSGDCTESEADDDDDEFERRYLGKPAPRRMSEHIAESMEF